MTTSRDQSLIKDILIGTIGGLAGTLAMQAYWKAVTKVSGTDPRTQRRKTNGQTTSIALLDQHHKEGESSTEALARFGYEVVEEEAPPKDRKEMLSQLIHWTYGAAQGAIFDAVSRRIPGPRWVQGLGWGGAMWLFGDELAVPALGLSAGPTSYPVRQHVHRFGAHLTYGMAAAMTTGALHQLLED